MGDPDVVIPVRRGDSNEELRYALRSLAAHLPGHRVWIAGHRPAWVVNVGHVPTVQRLDKHRNSLANLLAACRHPDVSEEFILWNDDFFALGDPPEGGYPLLHRGPAREFLASYGRASSLYLANMRATIKLLEWLGHPDPLSYELHVPMPMTKAGVLDAMSHAGENPRPVQVRTMYGNLSGRGGSPSDDVKVFDSRRAWEPGPMPLLSTVDHLWGRHPASLHVIRTFPEPGHYERTD